MSRLQILNKQKKKEVIMNNSKYHLNKMILTLAIVYSDIGFYLPTYYDFRGRIYSVVDYLDYQGVDTARALIEFSNGCELSKENIEYPLIQLANSVGKDKLTIKNRISWAENFINSLNILPYKFNIENFKNSLINEKIEPIKFESLMDNHKVLNIIKNNDKDKMLIFLLIMII